MPTSELDAALEKGGSGAALARAQAESFLSFLLKPEKQAKFATAIERLRQGDALESAVTYGYVSDILVLERSWRAELNRRTTLITIFLAAGCPAALLVGLAIVRAVRRRRRRERLEGRGRKSARGKTSSEKARVHIVLGRREERIEAPILPAEAEIPKVEHEGEWHTLH